MKGHLQPRFLSGGALSGIRTDKTHYPEALVVESERPERQNIEVSVFDVIFDYECILGAFDLFLLFGPSTYFESMTIYKKICNRRRSDLIVDT